MSRPYTATELERAIHLHDTTGLTWGVIAERFGRERASLASMVSAYRRGKLQFTHDPARVERYEQLRAMGVTISEIGRIYDISRQAVRVRLKRAGA